MSKYKLVCFDVDGTLVDNVEYSWQIFHDYFHVDQIRREFARESFFSGRITYLEWAEHDIALWMKAGATKAQFVHAMELAKLKPMTGALECIEELKRRNLRLAIVSGTLDVILDKVYPDYEKLFSYVFLSRLIFDNEGRLSGAIPTRFDMDMKADALRHIAEKENILLEECVFIGDHNNDVKIATIAGLGIAFNCKSDNLRSIADVVIKKKDLREILRYLI